MPPKRPRCPPSKPAPEPAEQYSNRLPTICSRPSCPLYTPNPPPFCVVCPCYTPASPVETPMPPPLDLGESASSRRGISFVEHKAVLTSKDGITFNDEELRVLYGSLDKEGSETIIFDEVSKARAAELLAAERGEPSQVGSVYLKFSTSYMHESPKEIRLQGARKREFERLILEEEEERRKGAKSSPAKSNLKRRRTNGVMD